MEVKITTIDEEFEKAQVKGFIRTRKGKMERVSPFERKGEKKIKVKPTKREGSLLDAEERESKRVEVKFKALVGQDLQELNSFTPKTPDAKKLKNKALTYYKESLEEFKTRGEFSGLNKDDWNEFKYMRNMYIGDARDMLRIADAIDHKNYSKASDIIDDMDTAARDEIPDRIINRYSESWGVKRGTRHMTG